MSEAKGGELRALQAAPAATGAAYLQATPVADPAARLQGTPTAIRAAHPDLLTESEGKA
ncbi:MULTISPECIES: hypothetical protein [Streptomyces]|uniref:hypothetical protein n=1 Tax=Streptomyces TaxID=1883 RepID=UPI0014886F3A|nr:MULTISPECIES: hypothetical protein [Streptomyces]